jgi:hypothetical protein
LFVRVKLCLLLILQFPRPCKEIAVFPNRLTLTGKLYSREVTF